jgi:hypothetical protein
MVYFFSSSTALAMQYGKKENPKYTQTTAKNLKGIPQFIFHVPIDKNLVTTLMKNRDIRVLLVGRDKSVNFGDIDSCGKNR